jgi:uncharacterized protein (TIGR02246 family)
VSEHLHETVVRDAFRAYADGDLDAFAALFTDDVVWHVPGTNRFSGRFDGAAAVRERMGRLATAGVRFDLEPHDVLANDEHAVALVSLHVTNAAGQRYDQQQVQVWHFRDGRCAEYWAMNQDQAVLDVLLDGPQGGSATPTIIGG